MELTLRDDEVKFSVTKLEVVSRYRDPQLQVTEICVICKILSPKYISVSISKAYFTFKN